MLLLSVDTSGRQGSIALAQGNSDGTCELVEMVPLEGGTFSAQLIPQVASLLAKHKFRKADMGGLIAASGPGSFTGIRVGLAAIKALSEATGKPIAAVSLLEAIALTGGKSGRVLAAMDAGRGEIYLGEYEVASSGATMIIEKLVTKAEFADTAGDKWVVTTEKGIAEMAGAKGILIGYPGSDLIARLGWKKILAGEILSPEALEANYIRRTDAEIFAKFPS